MLPLLNFIAFLSINLGVINLLPLPALDGGHFVLLVLEAVRGKPLGARATNAISNGWRSDHSKYYCFGGV